MKASPSNGDCIAGRSCASEAARWHRPTWSGARLRPRWLLLSLLAHAVLIAGIVGAEWSRQKPAPPRLALQRVLGTEPEPAREPPVAAAPQVEIEEPLAMELPPLDVLEPEPFPIEFCESPAQVLEPVVRPRHRPDLTMIRRIAPPPPIVNAPPAPPPAIAGAIVGPVPIDEANEPPRYPPRAIQLRQQGETRLLVVVDVSGRVVACRVVVSSGYELLDRAALAAVCKWRFRGGAGEVELPVAFVLHDPATRWSRGSAGRYR